MHTHTMRVVFFNASVHTNEKARKGAARGMVMKCTSTFGTAHFSFSFAVRLRPPAPAWSSRRKDVECLTTQDRPSLSKRPGMRCTGSRKKLRMCKNMCLMYIHQCSHTLIMHICKKKTHHTSLIAFLKEQWDMHDEENPHELCLS